MSTWVIVVLIVLAVWLSALTLVMLLVIRQVGMLTVLESQSEGIHAAAI